MELRDDSQFNLDTDTNLNFLPLLGSIIEVQADIVEDVSKISNVNANNVNTAPTNGKTFFFFPSRN